MSGIKFTKKKKDSVRYAPRQSWSKYAELADQVALLKKSEALIVAVPEDIEAEAYRIALAAGLRRQLPERLAGCVWCRKTADGKISITREA